LTLNFDHHTRESQNNPQVF